MPYTHEKLQKHNKIEKVEKIGNSEKDPVGKNWEIEKQRKSTQN